MAESEKEIEPIFCADDDWQANACLGWSGDPMELYAAGYREAADQLAGIVLSEARHQDILGACQDSCRLG